MFVQIGKKCHHIEAVEMSCSFITGPNKTAKIDGETTHSPFWQKVNA